MFLKIFTKDKVVLEAILQFLAQKRLLLDYAPIFQETNGFTQIVRVKCDEKALTTTLRSRFKKNFEIIK
jgi:hypothetical protein